MSNVTGAVNDIFDLLSNINLKQGVLLSTMTEVLEILEENLILDDFVSDLEACRGIDPLLDQAIDDYYDKNSFDEGDVGEDDDIDIDID